MKKQDNTKTKTDKTDKTVKTNRKTTKGSTMQAEYEQRPDGLTNGTDSVLENLAQNAWFPALYADETLTNEFPAGPLV